MLVVRLILQHLVLPYPLSTNYRITRVASSGGRVFALGAKCRGFKSLVALSIISKLHYIFAYVAQSVEWVPFKD